MAASKHTLNQAQLYGQVMVGGTGGKWGPFLKGPPWLVFHNKTYPPPPQLEIPTLEEYLTELHGLLDQANEEIRTMRAYIDHQAELLANALKRIEELGQGTP